MPISDLPKFIRDNYEIYEWKHAITILEGDFQNEWRDLISVLSEFRLNKSYINVPGGSKSLVADWIDSKFNQKGWQEKAFETSVKVDENIFDSPTHSADCFKNRVALEIEWNNKDPFFDRDLNNFM